MSENKSDTQLSFNSAQGYVCPFCGTDCSPIAGEKCAHLFLVDGENGWRFVAESKALFDAAIGNSPALFRDLLYHDPKCRAHLKLQRANYDDSLEIYVFSGDMDGDNRRIQVRHRFLLSDRHKFFKDLRPFVVHLCVTTKQVAKTVPQIYGVALQR